MDPIASHYRASREQLAVAVHHNEALSREGALERLFTYLFSDLVYPQIWEDPVVDMDALCINRTDHVVAIASGGCNVASYLVAQPAASADCFVLLDAQDWMNDADLNALWAQISRTARPGARVIFRTAADEPLLPGRLNADILALWRKDEARSVALHARDRSAIYGGFHLYRLKGMGQ